MKKPTVKKSAKAKAPAPVSTAPAPAPVTQPPLPATAAELRTALGVQDRDHLFVNGKTGEAFQLIAVEGENAFLQCQSCGRITEVPVKVLLTAKVGFEENPGDNGDSTFDELPVDHPLREMAPLLKKLGIIPGDLRIPRQ